MAQAPEPIKVGLLIPLTGPRADAGSYIKNAAILAAEKLKSHGTRMEFVIEDTRYQPKEALSGLRKCMLQSIQFVVSGGGSGEVLAIAPQTERSKIIVLVPGAQSEEISSAGELIFRFMHNTAQEPAFFAKEVSKRMTGGRLAIFSAQFSATPPYLKHFIPAIKDTGKEIGLMEEFEVDTTDVRSQLMRLKRSGEKDLFMIAPAGNEGRIMVQAHQLGLSLRFFGIGMESPELLRIAGPLADGLLYAYSFDASAPGSNAALFTQLYRDRFGVEADAIAANTYDALLLLSSCASQTHDSALIARCLYSTKDYNGAGGRFSINEHGDAEKPLFLKTIKQGRYVRLAD